MFKEFSNCACLWSSDSVVGPLTPSHVGQRRTSVTATVDGASSDSVGNVTDENAGRDGDAVDPACLPLLGGNEANVAEALEVCNVTTRL